MENQDSGRSTPKSKKKISKYMSAEPELEPSVDKLVDTQDVKNSYEFYTGDLHATLGVPDGIGIH